MIKIHVSNKPCKMIPGDLVVTISETGKALPHCQAARDYCELAGVSYFSPRQIDILKKRGHNVHTRQRIVSL